MSVGPIVVAAGLALMVRATGSSGYLVDVLPPVAVLGLGLAITVAPLTSTVLAAAPAEHTGVASAINNDVARTASLVAVAVLPVAAGITGDSYLHPAQFASSFHSAMLLAAAACAVGGVLAVFTIDNPPRRVAPAAGPPIRHHSYCALDGPPWRRDDAA
jgi:hypothetical protein